MSGSDLSAVLRPIGEARGLPNDHYVSDRVFAEERERVLFDNWAGISTARAVPNPGDVLPVDFLGMPLLVARDRDGTLRVFQNTCRHRGMILVETAQNIGGVLRCPYHSWCYSLDGALRATPHVGGPGHNTHETIHRPDLGLVEVPSHVWLDVVFVNVNGNAGRFEDYAADAMARWAEYGKPIFHGGAESSFSFDVACNWKLAVENYCESYHLPWVHPGLNSYSRLEDHYHIESPGRFSGQGTLVYRPMLSADGRRFPDFEGLAEKWETGAEYIALYPNVLLGVHRDHVFSIILQPVAKDRTIEHVEIYYATPEAAGPDWQGMRETNAKMWYAVFEEDLFVVEGMQRGRNGRLFDGGKFSPVMDGPTHMFHHWVASQLAAPKAAAE